MSSQSLKVYQTRDYGMFKRVPGNRPVSMTAVNHLVKAMEKEDLHDYDPIMVDESMAVIDGQHRLEARKILNREVHYIVSESNGKKSIDIIQGLNSCRKNWTNEAKLQSFVVRGFKHYVLINDFLNTFKFPLSVSLVILNNSSDNSNMRSFSSGDFKVEDINRASKIAKMVNDFQKFYPDGYLRRSFVCALVKMFNNKEYSHKRMLEKMQYLSAKLVNCSDSTMYLTLLESIYNHKQSPETRVRFF